MADLSSWVSAVRETGAMKATPRQRGELAALSLAAGADTSKLPTTRRLARSALRCHGPHGETRASEDDLGIHAERKPGPRA